MIIRPGIAADIPALIAVDLSAGELFRGTHMDWAVGDHSSAEELSTAIGSGRLWVAEADGTPVGYLAAEEIDGSFYIYEVAVAMSHQRQGVGRRLIETALAAARDAGYQLATLTTDRTLPWNAPYYERLGFRVVEAPSPGLAARLASQPTPDRRCVMERALAIPL